MIVITGATGRLGSQIVDRLLTRVPAGQVAVSVRDAAKAAGLAARGVRVREAGFSDPASLAHAFEGASRVLIVSSNDPGADAVTQHKTAIDTARAAGAERVVYTSHQASAADSRFDPMRSHAATEQYLAGQSGKFTALGNGFYASTVPWLIGRALETGTLSAPADGPVSWTAHADLAEAAAVVLAQEHPFEGVTPPLTAPDALDLAEVAEILSELTGRTINRVVAEDDEWRAAQVEQGLSEARAESSLGLFRAARRGEFAVTGPALGELLGRPATPLRSLLAGFAGRQPA
ncbi:NAD(P)H-binding protein [Amycolatopsis sp. PS_44_ISF1]|uniref:NmrA family NAD(P)-binding protein n=1 Tax=Amycolatopsis sp. PS_44_ISF1 TaxID=2974917 RepID=UPI0028DE2599|nr:NAD(P)H-binding protein [Amycolatopsis sp. PS_44_ISF1]MDT8914727.1 NAD(P)H-binding protein [Amycolatopsis sp. PS_44_ISF1]